MKDLKQKLITLVEKCIDNENYKMVPMVVNKITKKPDEEHPGIYYSNAVNEKIDEEKFGNFKVSGGSNFLGGIKFIGEDAIKFLQIIKIDETFYQQYKETRVKSTKHFSRLHISLPITKKVLNTDSVKAEAEQIIRGRSTSDIRYELGDNLSKLIKTFYFIQTVVNDKVLLSEITKDEYNSFINRKKDIVNIKTNDTLDDIIEKVG